MNSHLKNLEQELLLSLEDLILSRSEKRSLKALLSEHELNAQQRDWLLSRVRDFAMDRVEGAKTELILGWFYECVKLLKEPLGVESTHGRAYFSPGEDCRDAILSQLRSAAHSIDICVFTISDDIIRDAIVSAHKVGKHVRIISDNDKSEDLGSDIDFLHRIGIPILLDKTEDHMHHKFALFEDKVLLTGSYNWTRSAAERNYENLILSEDPALLRAFRLEFDRIWEHLD